MISCVGVEIDVLGLSPVNKSPADHNWSSDEKGSGLQSNADEAVAKLGAELPVPRTYRASYWESIHQEGFHHARGTM